MSYRIALMAAAGTMALGSAWAQDNDGYYGALGVGYAFEGENNDFESEEKNFPTLDAQEFDTALDTSGGPAVYGALGKYFPRGLRGEIELAYRTQDVTDLPGDGLGFAGFPTGGNSENLALGDNNDLGDLGVATGMVNVYKDFSFDAAGRFVPYLGVGVGFAKVRAEFDNVDDQRAVTDADVNANLGGRPIGYRVYVQNSDYVTAFQGLAGAAFEITENLAVTAGYRYLQTGEFDFEGYVNNEVTDVTGEYQVHEATIGLRWNFGATAAPMAQPAQPEPQTKTCFDGTVVPMGQPCPTPEDEALTPEELRTVVYFDFDEAELTPAARALLERRADEARSVDVVEVIVAGNTDTVGSNAYNERLSARRAQVVREALVANGVDSANITIRALGETNLAKPTADGVREPLNRRTEVEFEF